MRTQLVCRMILGFFLVTLIACGGKYDDAKKTMTDFADAVETYVKALGKAEDSPAVAKAINAFADDLDDLAPKMKKIGDKYPELKNSDNVPEELKAIKERTDRASLEMGATFMKTMTHMENEEVKTAFERLGKVIEKMGN